MKTVFCLLLALAFAFPIARAEEGDGLTVAGYVPQAVEQAFLEAFPNVSLRCVGELNGEELARRIAAQDATVDIYYLPVDFTCTQLLQKGLAAPLDCSQTIAADVALMDASVRAALLDGEGRIAAYPGKMDVWYAGINEGYWRMLYPERALPQTFGEVLDAWIEWEADHAPLYPGLGFTDSAFDYPREIQKLVQAFVRQHGEAQPDFSAPALREALQKLHTVYELRVAARRPVAGEPDPQLETNASETGPGRVFKMSLSSAIASDSLSIGLQTQENTLYGVSRGNLTWLPIRFYGDDSARTHARLYAYVVNPHTRHFDEALRFIELLTDRSLRPLDWYAVHPEAEDPYEDPDFERKADTYTARKEECEQAIALAEENDMDSTNLRYRLEYYVQWLDNQESMRWIVSAETLARYRAQLQAAPLALHERSPFLCQDGTQASDMLQSLCARYAAGTLSLDRFLAELTQKMQMIEQENR